MRINIIFTALLLSLLPLPLMAQDEQPMQEEKFDYIPKIHGTFRARYELETERMEQRFQVRTTRISLEGGVCKEVDYKFQADFCDRGKFKMLDAWARVAITPQFKIQAGQFRVPISVDASRSPGDYYFANRSVIAKQIANLRAVGFKGVYKFAQLPLSIDAGIFNVTSMSDHNVWQKEMAYAAKARYGIGEFFVHAGFKSIVPDSIRVNLSDVAFGYENDRFIAEAEYAYKHYTNDSFDATHAYSVFASYWMPVKAGFFNRLSFQGRWDGMTDHSTGVRNDAGELVCDDLGRNRLTLGTTLSMVKSKNLRADLRLNYENYFYGDDEVGAKGDRDKVVLELAIKF